MIKVYGLAPLLLNLLRRDILVFFLLFAGVFYTKAQPKYSKLHHLTVSDGLSSNRIRCIYRDSKDFLWVGTDIGLDRYDSYEVKKYRHDDSKPGSFSSDIMTCIFEDRHKNLWFGTIDGLNRYNRSLDNFTVFRNNSSENSLQSNFVTGFVEDRAGNLWIVTGGNCLNKWDPASENFIRYPFAGKINGLSARPSRMAAIDSKGVIWIGSPEPGITSFDPETGLFTRYEDPSSAHDSYSFKSLYIDKQDKIWVATDNIGFFSYDPACGVFEHFGMKGDGKGTNLNFVLDIIPEDDRFLLLAVDQGGVNRFDKLSKTFEYIMNSDSTNEGLNNNGIFCFHRDKQGILWIGTSGGGINYYNPEKERFKLFTHSSNYPNSLSYDLTGGFYEDHEGMIWIGTDGGLDVYDPCWGTFKNFINDPDNPYSISGNVIRGIAEDKDHNIWVGTWGAGLNRYDRKTGRFIRYTNDPEDPSSISGNTIWNLFIDHNNTLWISIYNVGIDIFDAKRGVTKRFRHDRDDSTSLSSHNCWFIYQDQEKKLWICTQHGLNLFDRKIESFRVFHFPDDDIAAVYKDKSGMLWVGSNTEGLFLCDENLTIIKKYDVTNILPGNRIHAITQDKSGMMWISGNQGLSRLDPESQVVRNYTKEDGLQGDQFYQQSFLNTSSGELYFGGYSGFNSFFPDSLKDNEFVPPVYLTDFQIFNKPVIAEEGTDFPVHISEAKEIRLKWDQSVFSFSFAAINYNHPQKNQYAYIMNGFEKEWNYTDAQRRYVTYTNLDPGEYTFKVKASNNDGVWNEDGVSLKVTILPPWWHTWWFRIMAAVLVILIFTSIMLFRVRQLNNQKLLLEKTVAIKTSELNELNASKDKFFSIIAHDLKNPFNTIIGFSEMLKEAILSKNADTIFKYASIINSSSVQTFRLLENLLAWAGSQHGKISLNPEKIGVSELISEEIAMIDDMARRKEIEIICVVSEALYITTDKNMLRTILRNLITNAVKFTHKNGRITIEAGEIKNHLEISVSDNGIGMTKEIISKLFRIDSNLSTRGTEDEKGTGLGLVLCKEFIGKLGGSIQVESEVWKGSTFRVNIPVEFRNPIQS